MDDISLVHSSGNAEVDRILRGLIGIFETAFPGRVRAYYLAGSRADGSEVAASDLDFRAVFRDGFRPGEEERARLLRRYCGLVCSMDLDMPMLSEELLTQPEVPEKYGYALGEALGIKTAGQLLYGEEMRDRIVEPAIEAYAWDVSAAPYLFAVRHLRKRESVVFPLAYPDPDDEFFGYVVGNDTQSLVLIAGWIGTAIIAMQAGRHVPTKKDWPRIYAEHIGDEWTAYQAEVYSRCKQQWGYRVPDDAGEQAQLRELCRQALAFENHYFGLYRRYLLAELGKGECARMASALHRFARVVYTDEEVREAVRAAGESSNEEVRQAARETLERIDLA